MIAFVDQQRKAHGVEPICSALLIAPSTYYEQKARQVAPLRLPERTRREAALSKEIERVWHENRRVYGARKVWRQLHREDISVARCTVERLMRRLGISGVVRGRKTRTTIPGDVAAHPMDLVQWDFTATCPSTVSSRSDLHRHVVRLRVHRIRHRCVLHERSSAGVSRDPFAARSGA